jgi:hypothetical protein
MEKSSRSLDSTQGHALRIRTRFVELIEKLLDKGSASVVLDVPQRQRDRKRREPDSVYRAHTASGLRGVHGLMLEPLSLPDKRVRAPGAHGA